MTITCKCLTTFTRTFSELCLYFIIQFFPRRFQIVSNISSIIYKLTTLNFKPLVLTSPWKFNLIVLLDFCFWMFCKCHKLSKYKMGLLLLALDLITTDLNLLLFQVSPFLHFFIQLKNVMFDYCFPSFHFTQIKPNNHAYICVLHILQISTTPYIPVSFKAKTLSFLTWVPLLEENCTL